MSHSAIYADVIFSKLSAPIESPSTGEGEIPLNVPPSVPDVKTPSSAQRYPTLSEQEDQYITELTQRIAVLEQTHTCTADSSLSPRHGLRALIKRVIRRLLRWYIEPVCDRQTLFNDAVTPAIGRLTELELNALSLIHDSQNIQEQDRAALTANISAVNQSVRQAERKFDDFYSRMDIDLSSKAQQIDQLSNRFNRLATDQSRRLDAQEKTATEQNRRLDAQEKTLLQVTSEHNGRLDTHDKSLADVSSLLGKVTAEHNGRLDALEDRMAASLDVLNALRDQMQQLHEEGLFEQIQQDAGVIRRSSSQSGEDTILDYVLMVLGVPAERCTYLDLGANHAKFLSNTYYFYRKGARGVLVEANPALIGELKLFRSGDIILNRCITDKSGDVIDFYVLNADGLSTPDKAQAEEAMRVNDQVKLDKVVPVQTATVNELMEEYFDGAPVFLNIDLEGADMDILHSIDFNAHRPLLISIETIPYRPHLVVGHKNQEVIDFLSGVDYVEYAFTGINSIFLDKRQINAEVLE